MTSQQKFDFLAELGRSGNRTFAAAISGVTVAAAVAARNEDPVFERHWRSAAREARAELDRVWPGRRAAA